MGNSLELLDRYAERMGSQRDVDLKELGRYVARTEKVTKDAGEYRGKVKIVLDTELTELGKVVPQEVPQTIPQQPEMPYIPTPIGEEQTTAVVVQNPAREPYIGSDNIRGPVASVLLLGTMLAVGYLNSRKSKRR